MKYWILYAGAAAQALPILAAAVRGTRRSGPRQAVLVWCGFLVSVEILLRVLGAEGRNTHLLNYVLLPVADALALWMASLLQAGRVARLGMRLMIPLLAITWAVLVAAVENTQTFSLLAEPFAGLLLLGASVFTLVVRAQAERGRIARQDWFWFATGLAIYSGSAVALPPAAALLLERSPQLVIQAYGVKSVLDVLAFLVISGGFWCPLPVLPPGGSSSAAFARSPSASGGNLRG